MNSKKGLLSGVLLTLAVLSGCAKELSEAAVATQAQSRQLQPTDAKVAAIYNRSCRSCHTVTATGAPLTGDKKEWSIRSKKGMDTLVNNVVRGFGGMPPFGLCMDCGVEEFEALIGFMAQSDGLSNATDD